MADFRDLEVYKQARVLNKEIFLFLRNISDRNLRDQLSRASTSILLNIAEGSGRFSLKDKRNFFIIARASALECMALMDVMEDLEFIASLQAMQFREKLEGQSKMLFRMIKACEQ